MNLQGVTSCQVFLKKLKQLIVTRMGSSWDSQQIQRVQSLNESEDITAFIVSFFNQTPDSKIQTVNKHLQSDSRRKFLLLLEDVEDLITEDEKGKKFKRFLKEVYENCELLQILLCSHEWIGHISDTIMPTIISILELDAVSSVKLFMEKTAGEFKPEEILKLVLENPQNCLEILLQEDQQSENVSGTNEETKELRSANNRPLDFQESDKRKMLEVLRRNRETRIQVLSAHDMFK